MHVMATLSGGVYSHSCFSATWLSTHTAVYVPRVVWDEARADWGGRGVSGVPAYPNSGPPRWPGGKATDVRVVDTGIETSASLVKPY